MIQAKIIMPNSCINYKLRIMTFFSLFVHTNHFTEKQKQKTTIPFGAISLSHISFRFIYFRRAQYQEQGSDVCDTENYSTNGHEFGSRWAGLSTLLSQFASHVQCIQNI